MFYKSFFKKCNDPPEYFQSGKFYTMGPGIDFPLIMNYTDTNAGYGEPYFYFLNGHGDVTYFADQNFTEEQIETYEYTPWGVLLTSASKNNLLYTAREFDFDVDLQFNRMRYYNANLGRFMQKDLIFILENHYIYVGNRPIYYIDPFGLLPPSIGRFFWVNPFLPSPGGGPFNPDCMNPVSEFDCVYGCWSYDSCSLCCAGLYPRDDQKEERDKCENRCYNTPW